MEYDRTRWRATLVGPVLGGCLVLLAGLVTPAAGEDGWKHRKEQLVPILGVTMDEKPRGTVVYLILSFRERTDHSGLAVHFRNSPGRFSHMAQTSVQQAIIRAANSMQLSTDSWSVVLTVPHSGLTVYGESLSAMVSLAVMAMAKGEFIASDRVMTGTVTPDGHIGPVGSVPLKVNAAEQARLRRVVVPEEQDPADSDWRTPFLMQVSPVGSVPQAYVALTEPFPSR